MKTELSNILTKAFLEEEHLVKQKNASQIGRDVGCNYLTVIRYLKRRGVRQIHYKSQQGCKMSLHHQWKGHGEIPNTYWRNIRNSGKTRNIPVSITIEEGWHLYLRQNRRCAMTGREIGFIACNKNSASLDRKDSSKGYSLDNVQWVHQDVNFAKQSLSIQKFIELCQEVVSYSSP